MKEIGHQVETDTAFVRDCRLKQSKFRAKNLDQECGVGPTATSKNTYGNMLVNGKDTGSNFVSNAAFLYAKQRVQDKAICPDLTIDE